MTLGILGVVVPLVLIFCTMANERRNETRCKEEPSFAQNQKNVEFCAQVKARSTLKDDGRTRDEGK
jgi:hypothetical protein